MSAALHRLVVWLTGQPDSMATPRPSMDDTTGPEHTLAMVRGDFDRDVHPDAYRTIAPPPAPRPLNHRASAARWALVIALALWLGLALLLKLCGARSLP